MFVSGLKEYMQDQVNLYDYFTLKNVLHLALRIEFNWKEKEGQGGVTHPTTSIVNHGSEKIKRNMINPHPSPSPRISI